MLRDKILSDGHVLVVIFFPAVLVASEQSCPFCKHLVFPASLAKFGVVGGGRAHRCRCNREAFTRHGTRINDPRIEKSNHISSRGHDHVSGSIVQNNKTLFQYSTVPACFSTQVSRMNHGIFDVAPCQQKKVYSVLRTWCHRGVGTCELPPLDQVAADIGNLQPAT